MSNVFALTDFRAFLVRRFGAVIVTCFIVLCTVGMVYYVYFAAPDSITRDEWKFMPVLRHWYSGQLTLSDIWDTNSPGSEHRTPAFRLYFIANAALFGLDVRLGCYIGVLALGLLALCLYRHFIRSGTAAPETFDHLAFIPVALGVFSFAQSHFYTYDLLAMFAIVGTFWFVALWTAMDSRLRTPQPWWRYAGLMVSMVLALVLFGAGKGPAIVLATLVMIVSLAVQAEGGKGTGFRMLAWMGAALLAAESIYWYGGAGKMDSGMLGSFIGRISDDPLGAAEYVLHALGASVVIDVGLQRLAVGTDTVGLAVLAFSLLALYLYLRMRLYRQSLVPLTMALFVGGYLGELLIARFGRGTENGAAPRYVFTDHLLAVACLFVCAMALRRLHAAGRRRLSAGLLALLVLGVASLEGYNLSVDLDGLSAHKRSQDRAVAIAKARLAGASTPYPRWYCPSPRVCDEGVRFLAAHRLSFFHEPRGKRHPRHRKP
ncbi:MAG TPA: hypothetical protein VF651_00580 [Gammaproteobacteria bacterium]